LKLPGKGQQHIIKELLKYIKNLNQKSRRVPNGKTNLIIAKIISENLIRVAENYFPENTFKGSATLD
jgi:hypothetical protein